MSLIESYKKPLIVKKAFEKTIFPGTLVRTWGTRVLLTVNL